MADSHPDSRDENDASQDENGVPNTDWSMSNAFDDESRVNAAMERVGGTLGLGGDGRSDSAGTSPSDTSQHAADRPADDVSSEEDDTTGDEGSGAGSPDASPESVSTDEEPAPAEKVVDDLLGESDTQRGAEGPADDVSSEEESPEDVSDEDVSDEGDETSREEPIEEPLPTSVRDEVQQTFPDTVIETKEDLSTRLEEARRKEQMVAVMDRLAEQDPALAEYVELRVQEEASHREAAFAAFEDVLSAPDPEQNPEAYADWKLEREKAQERQQQDAEQADQIEQTEQRVQDQMARSLKAARQQLGLGEEQFDRFVREVQRYTAGDERGNVPSDFGRRMYIALHAEGILQSAREKARQEGRTEGRQEARSEQQSRRLGDGLPTPDSSGSGPASDPTDEEAELADIGQSFDDQNVTADDFSL
jgi:tRNA splicing endonuclease